MDGALTVQPSTLAVPPARNAAASSMQSPPASAEATRVSSLSPAFAPPPRVTEVEVAVGELLQTEMLGERGREGSSPHRHQRWSSKAMSIRSGSLVASIEWVLPVAGT